MSWERGTQGICGRFEHFFGWQIGSLGLVVAQDVHREVSMYLTCMRDEIKHWSISVSRSLCFIVMMEYCPTHFPHRRMRLALQTK